MYCVVENGNYDLVSNASCVMDYRVYLVRFTHERRLKLRCRNCGQSLCVLVARGRSGYLPS
jgi:hypothetical protein